MKNIRRLVLLIAVVGCLAALAICLLQMQEEEQSVLEFMQQPSEIRLERKDGEDIQSCVLDGYYNLYFHSAFPQQRMSPVEMEVDQQQWKYRITYHCGLETDDPVRIDCLVGENWILIEDTVYGMETPQLWEGFWESINSAYEDCVERYGAEEQDKETT